MIAFIAIAVTPLASGADVGPKVTGGVTISRAATFPVSNEATGLTSLTIDPQKVGDLVILSTQIHSQSITVTGVSSPKTGTWHLGYRYLDPVNKVDTEEIWWAVATATGSTTVTATFSSSVASLHPELVADSYTTPSAVTWSFVAGNGTAATATSAVVFPSLTASAATNQLYWGYSAESETGVAGSTPGFTYTGTNAGNLIAENPTIAPNTLYAPTATDSPSGNDTAIAGIFAAS
jgi:hypothetical protein